MVTTIGELPKKLKKSIIKNYECQLLHTKKPFATGERYWNKTLKEWIPVIEYRCQICDGKNP